MDNSGQDPDGTEAPVTRDSDPSSSKDDTHLPESAEHFEHVLRRLVIEKEKSRVVPRAPLR
ncbi:MAG: hypothetical protein AAGC86_17465 [Pseudomonadota bacterium]